MKIRTEDAINHFPDGVAGVARGLKISRAAVYQWGEFVPESRAYQLHVLSKGGLPPKAAGELPGDVQLEESLG